MMAPYASASVVSGACEIHLLGVSHNSALYGKLAQQLIEDVKPDVVVLEADEARLREQARRGYQWLVEQDRQSVVQRALRPFLAESSIWARLTANDHHRHAHVLQNEGAALLEGGVYGGEVIMACHAATACGADIVLADRDKALSNARLLAARRAERLHRLQRMPDDDWALVRLAAGMAAARLAHHLHALVAPVTTSDAQAFAEHLHPIFMVAEVPAYERLLAAVGCEPRRVVAAVRRLLRSGCGADSQIESSDVAAVQDSIERIERQKHSMRSQALAPAGAAAHALEHAQSLVSRLQEACTAARDDAFSRWCARGAGRMFSFSAHEHGLPGGATHAELASAESEPAGGAVTPYYRTTVHERDCILAHRIQAVAAESGTKRVVAVVGANHLQGILRHWEQRRPDAGVRCAEFLAPPRATAACRAVERESLWKLHTVEGLAACMEGGAAVAAAAGPVWLSRRLPGAWRWSPLAVAGAAVCASAAWSAERHRRMAQLVHNLAAHQDSAARLQAA